MIVNSAPGPKINEILTKGNVKKNRPEGRLALLHHVGEGRLAIVNLDNLVAPVVQQSILNFVRSEAIRQVVLALSENLLNRHRLGHHAEHDGLRGIVGVSLRLRLGNGALILGADVLNHGGQVNSVIRVHEVVIQSGQSVLLHSVVSFLVLWVFLPFDVFIIAPIGYNVKLRVC